MSSTYLSSSSWSRYICLSSCDMVPDSQAVGGWVGGWVGDRKVEEIEAGIGMICCWEWGVGWVGGWMGGWDVPRIFSTAACLCWSLRGEASAERATPTYRRKRRRRRMSI